MRLLIVDGGTAPNGALNWTARTARQLAWRGHAVDLACRPQSALNPLLRDGPVRLHPLPMRHAADLGSVLVLARWLRVLRPEAVLLQGSRAIRLAGAALLLRPIPAVARMGIGRGLKRSPYDRWVYRRQITHFLVNARAVERELAAVPCVGEGRVSTIYNGVDTEWFRPGVVAALGVPGEWGHRACHEPEGAGGRAQGGGGTGYPKGRRGAGTGTREPARPGSFLPPRLWSAATGHYGPVIACVARLTADKGHRDLIAGLPALASCFPAVSLLLAGEGPLRETLAKQAANLGVGERVLFLGHVADVRSVLAAADVFVLPSYREGLPNAVLEAMAMGVPVVATDTDGTAEAVLDGETGCLVPPGDPEALARAVTRILEDDSAREALLRGARQLVSARFDTERAVEELEVLLRRVAG
jgi:glycosyltransferase involved in cell wall biosynthesis